MIEGKAIIYWFSKPNHRKESCLRAKKEMETSAATSLPLYSQLCGTETQMKYQTSIYQPIQIIVHHFSAVREKTN
jgi:hypothetical protein